MAWFTALLLSPWSKKKWIDPESLLPEFMREEEQPMTKEEAKKQLEEIKKEVGIE